MCESPCFIESPWKTLRALPFQVGVIAPLRHGKKTRPSEPAGTPSASRVISSKLIFATLSEYQRMLPPETKPGFSMSHNRESAWAWVSTRPVSSKTGSSAAAHGFGGARDVADEVRNHQTRSEAATVFVTAAHYDPGADLEADVPGRGLGQDTGHFVRRATRRVPGSRSVADSISADQSLLRTSYSMVEDAFE